MFPADSSTRARLDFLSVPRARQLFFVMASPEFFVDREPPASIHLVRPHSMYPSPIMVVLVVLSLFSLMISSSLVMVFRHGAVVVVVCVQVCDSLMGKSVDTPFFTLEIEHGGIFLGAVSELEYYNSSVEVLDYLDPDTFTYVVLEEHLNWLGYPKNQHIIYWCLLDKKISDGLVRITGDEDLLQVIRASGNHKVLVIMVDHSDFMSNFRQDLILKEPSFESPVRVANCSVDASNSGNIICLNVDNPISEVAEPSTKSENLITGAANLLSDVVQTHVLTDEGDKEIPIDVEKLSDVGDLEEAAVTVKKEVQDKEELLPEKKCKKKNKSPIPVKVCRFECLKKL
ncbi:hypothetical protein D1007_10687 [Hordeum vulgare]|nr:hypothetical protein D1007_10687 [Hordeum vulgare]